MLKVSIVQCTPVVFWNTTEPVKTATALAGAMTEAAVAASTNEILKASAMLVVDVGGPPADVAILKLNSRLKPPAPGQVLLVPKVGTMRAVLVCDGAFVSVRLPAA